jgi:hypothetical protein
MICDRQKRVLFAFGKIDIREAFRHGFVKDRLVGFYDAHRAHLDL